MYSKKFDIYIHYHPNSVNRIRQKILNKLIMILKNSPFSIQDKRNRDLDNAPRELTNLDDLTRDKIFVSKKINTVHRRRDLDSLG